jgi:FAD/FMN-containing dehydrogenase
LTNGKNKILSLPIYQSKEGPTMKARTMEGLEVDLKQDAIDGLRMRLKGQMLLPGEPGYEESRAVWNAMIDKHPALVVRCLGVADVIACVQFARENNLLLSIKGGGHNIAGLATAEGALMLDMSLMRGVWVDPLGKVAHAQAGCLLGDVDRETQLHGFAAVLGFVSLTGIAGLTLGGGFGYLTRRWGWAADNVVGMDVVTADAKFVRASGSENTDLFWGLRGGGGNFGVVTGIDYRLYPIGPEIVGGIIAWPASEASRVFELYRTLAAHAPQELTLALLMRLAPPAPWLPKDMHGKAIIAMLVCYSGNVEQGEKIVAPIKSFGKPIGDTLARRPYTQMQSLIDATQPKGRRGYWKSEYLSQITPAFGEKVIGHADRIRSPQSSVVLFQLEGALNRLSEEHTPVGNRDAHYVLNLVAQWQQAGEDAANIAWAREAWNDIKPFSTGGNYINFQSEDEGPERLQAAFGKGLQRLAEVKAKWDPENVFRMNRNIKGEKQGGT